jgi:Protein of unknown function (DUF2911)
MKLLRSLTWIVVAGLIAAPCAAQSAGAPALVIPPTNPRASVEQRVGMTDIEVSYSRPGVKGREVFGALVPWGQVWRTGSDNATRIRFSTAVKLNGVAVPAGSYELFTVPGRSAWTVIIHADQSQWGSYSYDPANDVARTTATPVELPELVESFTIGFSNVKSGSASLDIQWERTRVPVTIEVDVVGQVVPLIEAAMKAEGRKPYFLAAMFYYENKVDIDKAAEWITAAVAEQPTHIGMLHRQALILAEKGDTTGALEAARRSLAGAATSERELREEYTRLNTALIERLTRARFEP